MYNCGFKEELKYTPSGNSFKEKNSQRTRMRKIMWFNPPYSRSVKTNIVKNFLHLLVKHFPANNKMHKIFNKNTVKVILNPNQNHLGIIVERKTIVT